MAIETVVLAAARTAVPGIRGLACGSYRRMKPSSGDVDVILSHPDGTLKSLTPILDTLHRIGFLTADLTRHGDSPSNRVVHRHSYMGVCRLPRLPWHLARQLYIGWYKCYTPYPGTTQAVTGLSASARSSYHGATMHSAAAHSPCGTQSYAADSQSFMQRQRGNPERPCYLSYLPRRILNRIVFYYCGGTHRRIDIKVYPKHQFAFAVRVGGLEALYAWSNSLDNVCTVALLHRLGPLQPFQCVLCARGVWLRVWLCVYVLAACDCR